ncbi:YpdA family putative bacillithiol disulfide reductase [Paenibacillus psychroresistens]|uniref:YpdA family putative bacillithiol disulfide reductase n=1 Tax=Paenibacillus psychroresistens TaxID=1778678 RepID=A0A6B8RKJ1_9BACL|nr:YpdA family putative bacillithiol disulfide reductase [Paenibacillus psychroresistens]QGQ96347.1 YpdA family putative bacillithiol disulfide reductase [Paenibacillus psychroresistens]
MRDVIIVGAGPCGISAAIELQLIQLQSLIIEKNSIVHSIYMYPTYMSFFSTPELLEIGNIPFTTPNEKPTRTEALVYYRNVAKHYKLAIQPYEAVIAINQLGDHFEVQTLNRFQETSSYEARHVVIALGYFEQPNLLNIPGESLSKVTHYFREAHPYTGMKVAIIGGSNSAVDAALELNRVGAEVTVIYRGEGISTSIKPWVRPHYESLVKKGTIRMLFQANVKQIDPRSITIQTDTETVTLENDFVLALTGFRPNRKLLEEAGVRMQPGGDKPEHNPETMETNVKGLYIAGVIASGENANEVFIETGRFHGRLIAQDIAEKLADSR